MTTYDANTILRIMDGAQRLATARVVKDGSILEVVPRSFKMYKNAQDWVNDQSSYNELVLHAETPEDREKEHAIQQTLKQEAEQARLAMEPPDIQKVRALYDELHLKDSLTKEHWKKVASPGLWVELGTEITPVWFSRKTSKMLVGVTGDRMLPSFSATGRTYTGIFYTKGSGVGSLKRIIN